MVILWDVEERRDGDPGERHRGMPPGPLHYLLLPLHQRKGLNSLQITNTKHTYPVLQTHLSPTAYPGSGRKRTSITNVLVLQTYYSCHATRCGCD